MKKITLLILQVLVSLAVAINAQSFEENGMSYTPIDETTARLTDGHAVTGDITVPETAGGYTVTEIGEEAFSGNAQVTSLQLPATLKLIAHKAFFGCSGLTGTVTLPKGITVEQDAFTGCNKVRNIVLMGVPKKVENASLSFSGIFNVKLNIKTPPAFDPQEVFVQDLEPDLEWVSLVVPEGCASAYYADEKWCIFGEINTEDFGIPADEDLYDPGDEPNPDDPIVPEPYEGTLFVETAGTLHTLIGDGKYTTTELALSGILNGDDILYLREMCGTSLDGSVTGQGALQQLDLSHARIVKGGGPYYCYIDTYYTANDVVGNNMFSSCVTLTSVLLPEKTKSIRTNAFRGNMGLKEVGLGQELKSIGMMAFCESGIESLDIPDCCESIGEQAFHAAASLKHIHLPAALRSLKFGVFYFCVSLEDLVIPESVTKLEDLALFNCQRLKELTIPAALTDINMHGLCRLESLQAFHVDGGNTAYCDVDGVLFNKDKTTIYLYPNGLEDENYSVPEGVTTIGTSCFWKSSMLKSVTLPAGIKTIENGAFEDCQQLESVNLPDGLEFIGNMAFAFCPQLSQVVIPESVIALGSTMFMSSGITSFALPEGFEEMPYEMLYGCTKLTEATLSSSCRYVDERSFYGCTAMKHLIVNALTPPDVFVDEDDSGDDSFMAPRANGGEPVYSNAFGGGIDLGSCKLTVPEGCLRVYAEHPVWKQFDIQEVSAINEINIAPKTGGPCYNLSGQRVDPTYRGIIIKDGKKMIIVK